MRIGIHLHPFPRNSVEGFRDLVQRADQYGFGRLGTGDTQWHNMECFIALTLMALHTRKAQIGSRVTNPVTREPSVVASAIASIDVLSGGRAVLAIGRGDSAVHNIGLRPATLDRFRAYVLAVRELLDQGETVYRGRLNRFVWPRSPAQRRIPICVAAEGPKMLRLAGQIADEVLVGSGLLPEVIEDSLEKVYAGVREVGRDPSEIEVWWAPRLSIASTREAAIKNIKASVASAGNHALRSSLTGQHVPERLKDSFRRFHERYDYAEHGVKTGKNARLIDELGLTDYLLQRFAVVGTPEEVAERIKSLGRLGLKNFWMSSPGDDPKALELMGEKVLPFLA